MNLYQLIMLRRTFVSVSFATQGKLQLLELNSSKKKVKNHHSLELPDGLIANMRVQDGDLLAKILKDLWKKTGFKEKAVGIVIPEPSTYTKVIEIPKLQGEELDEAVRWQAYEFLPAKPSELVLDWKILKENNSAYHILVIAVLKEVLQGYVKAVSKAGLFPLVVETPSLSLARIADKRDVGRLLIYESFGEVTIILVAQGDNIISSSMLKFENQDEIIKVSLQMLKHYGIDAIEGIIVGGTSISEEIAKKIGDRLQKPYAWFKPAVSGFNAAQYQEYLIPISLQLKDAVEPADETTVNLLPQELVRMYANKRLKSQIWSLTLLVTLIVWINFFAVMGVYIFLEQQIREYKQTDFSNKISPDKAQAIQQIEEINKVSTGVLAISQITYPPEVVLNAISTAKPEGVNILKYKINFESGVIDLIGTSSTRQTLIDFKDAIEEYKDFSLVQIPITSFEQEADLQFTMTFSYLPAAPKTKVRR